MGYQAEIVGRYFSGRPLCEITPPEIEAMIASRLADGVSQSTTMHQRAFLSGLFSFAIFEGLYPGPNPVRRVRRFKIKNGRKRFLSREEGVRLVGRAPSHIRPIILFGLYTGGRLQELLMLRRSDLEMFPRPAKGEDGREIHGLVHFRGKGGKYRTVPIASDLAIVIEHLNEGGPLDALFTWRGRPLKSIRTAFENARDAAGLGHDVVVHTLRHTFASWYMMNGGDIYVLRDLMGHASIAQTQIYAHLSPAHLQKSGAFIGAPKGANAQD